MDFSNPFWTSYNPTYTILLICGGIGVYDSFVVSFSTMASGGFSIKSASIAGYGSTYVSIVLRYCYAYW